jgi:zinc transport system ATP-binding protein
VNLIEVKNLSLGYGGKAILKGLNFDVSSGDFICIVGPNGAGKSTLIKTILGLLRPLAGKIKFSNLEQKFIGYMPQETLVDPNFPASVLEIVLSGTLNRGARCFYDKAAKADAISCLDELGISNLRDKSFTDLSGGQRQKVLLARALAATKSLLILDEPSNNLDKKSKKELYSLVNKLNKERGITILMVTHDLDHNNLIGNKILSLQDGDVFFGATEEFVRKVHHG